MENFRLLHGCRGEEVDKSVFAHAEFRFELAKDFVGILSLYDMLIYTLIFCADRALSRFTMISVPEPGVGVWPRG